MPVDLGFIVVPVAYACRSGLHHGVSVMPVAYACRSGLHHGVRIMPVAYACRSRLHHGVRIMRIEVRLACKSKMDILCLLLHSECVLNSL